MSPNTYQELLQTFALGPAAHDLCQQFVGPDATESRSSERVLELARRHGAGLAAAGLVKGDRVGILVESDARFLPVMHGCLLYGFVAVPLYAPPLFKRASVHEATLTAIAEAAGVQALVVERERRDSVRLPFGRVLEVEALEADGPPPERLTPQDLAFLQFTSGSEGRPKGVCISHGALMANARAIMLDGLAASDGDHGVSWLPLYHDMGLVGFGLAPLLTRTPVTFIPTRWFVRHPSVWLKTLSRYRATITFAPNFAYGLATRRVSPEGLDLGSVRMWGCGAEPISNATLEAFEQRFARSGVKAGQVSPCYGLAEATLAVTFTPPSSGRVVENIDADAWERRGVAEPAATGRALSVVSCGLPLGATRVSVVDAERGTALPERMRGEIVVESPSLGAGYVGEPSESRAFRDGRLFTGDLGYLADGQLFVTGRSKDTVIQHGRNYDPHVIEASAMGVSGVRLAAAVNVASPAGDLVVVMVERGGQDEARLAEAVRARVASEVGVEAQVFCVAPGGLPRTTSGKLKRARVRELASERVAASIDPG